MWVQWWQTGKERGVVGRVDAGVGRSSETVGGEQCITGSETVGAHIIPIASDVQF